MPSHIPPPAHSAIVKSNHKTGQSLIFALIFLSILAIVATAIISISYMGLNSVRYSYHRSQTTYLSEAGIDYAVHQLSLNPAFTGTSSPIALNNGEFEISINGSGTTREITSTAYIPSKDNYRYKKSYRVNLTTQSTNISFNYGVQTGDGGIVMANNSTIAGNVYSNGNILGANGASINGTAIVAGGTEPTPSSVWSDGDTDYAFGQSGSNIDVAQSFTATQATKINKLSLNLKKVGAPANITIRVVTDNSNKPSVSTISSGTLYSSLVTGNYGWADITMNSNVNMINGNKYWIVFDATANLINYWSWKFTSGAGYPNNNGMYSQIWNNKPWNAIAGDMDFKVYSGGVDTYIRDVNVDEDVYAHIATNVSVGRDFYGYIFNGTSITRDAKARELYNCSVGRNAYADIDTCSVTGTKFPGSGEPDKPNAGYAISDANITEFKTNASVATITPPTGTYTIDGVNRTLGPTKINGNLTLTNGAYLTLTGSIYVTGDITLSNNAIIDLDYGYGNTSGMIIADGRINISNNCIFHGTKKSGGGYVPDTYIMLISTYTSTTTSAFELANNSISAIIFSPNGPINMSNNTNLKEATGYKLVLANNSTITYESGLQNILFTSGPGGGWQIQPGTWREVNI